MPITSNKKRSISLPSVDIALLLGILTLLGFGLFIMYSASGQDLGMMQKQINRIIVSLICFIIASQIHPRWYETFAPGFFVSGAILLIFVLFFGDSSKGAQRWLDLGVIRFQPSEILKLVVPLMVARYISRQSLPPSVTTLFISLSMVIFPTILIARQPDLGTSILIAASGIFVIFLAGISWKIIAIALTALGGFIPVLWYFLMHEYQKKRVLTLFDPESDPLNAGYHIIQSNIAIGSGGISGKGWLHGTQSQLEFLPERHTDFIFAVIAEELGMLGFLALMAIYLFIIARGLYLATQIETAFGRMVAGSIILSFFVYIFVNIGMVSGILPVVGVPLPLISYGGTSMLTLMIGFGILMSTYTHRKSFSKAT